MSVSDKDRRIAFSIISHLQTQLDSNIFSEDSAEGVSVALQCLSAAYNLELGNEEQVQKYGVKPTLEVGELVLLRQGGWECQTCVSYRVSLRM